jgi:hypothetical protein
MCVVPPWPFSISQSHSCNSCALAIAIGSDKQSKCCHTHQVLVITMKSKGNNNKPVLKVVTTKTLQPLKRYHSADVCLAAVTRPRHNSFRYLWDKYPVTKAVWCQKECPNSTKMQDEMQCHSWMTLWHVDTRLYRDIPQKCHSGTKIK